MEKEGKIPKKEEIEYLNQLILTLDEFMVRLEEAYQKKDYDNFDEMRKSIYDIFAKIGKIAQ